MAVERFDGFWWTKRGNRRPGVLEIDEEGTVVLRLNGIFADFQSYESPQRGSPSRRNVIRGRTADGRLFTLVDCVQTGTSGPLGKPHRRRAQYHVGWYIVGAHFRNYSELRFHEVSVACEHLNELVGSTFIWPTFSKDHRRFRVTYRTPAPIKVSLGDFTVGVTQWVPIQPGSSFLEIRESAAISIRSSTRRHFDEFWDGPARDVLSLLRFMAERRLTVEHVHATVGRGRTMKRCRIFLDGGATSGTARRLGRPQDEFLFTVRGLRRRRWASVVNQWSALRPSLGPVLALYAAATENRDLFTELRFLILAQALETYHRVRRRGTRMSLFQHKQRLSRVLGNLSEGDRQWANNALLWSNELTLRERLAALYDDLGQPLQDMLPDRETFLRQVVSTRNFLTHFSDSRKRHVLKDFALIDMAEKLRWVLQFHLLRELHFSKVPATWTARGAPLRGINRQGYSARGML